MKRQAGAVAAWLGGLSLTVLAVVTWRVDLGTGFSPATSAIDVGVGLAFPAAAVASRSPASQRWLLAVVGPAWLLASAIPMLVGLHRALLVVALVAFPTGRLNSRSRWLGAAAAALTLGGSQAVTAAVFASVAALTAFDRRRTRGLARWYPVTAAGIVSIEQLLSAAAYRWSPSAVTPDAWLVLYEAALVTAAVVHVPAARAAETTLIGPLYNVLEARLAEPVSSWSRLAAELGEALGDRHLIVYRWEATLASFVDESGSVAAAQAPWLIVDDDGHPVAAVASTSGLLTDPFTSGAVERAVQLAVRADLRQESLVRQVVEVEEARARLLHAADAQREAFAERVHGSVLPPLHDAVDAIAVAGSGTPSLAVARVELAAVERELDDIVAGVPPADLGGGRLPGALTELAARSVVPVRLHAPAGWAAPADTELALFYVAAEALSNALKHADASHVLIELSAEGVGVELSVSDDGRGGADPQGVGLEGLADRVAVQGGRLFVTSPVGRGTRVSARIPTS